MKSLGSSRDQYLEEFKKRRSQSKAYTNYQVLGLEIAEILNDSEHRSLYIKLAKDNNPNLLLQLAKSVAEKRHVKNRGAYFMKVLEKKRREE
jgi:adenylate kinase